MRVLGVPIGDATILGGGGADVVNVFSLPANALLDVQGGAGDDTLMFANLAALQGHVFFNGGEGTDHALFDASAATAAVSLLLCPLPGQGPTTVKVPAP